MRTHQYLSERRMRLLTIFFALLIALTFLLIIAAKSGASNVDPQPAVSLPAVALKGEWTASLRPKVADQVQITFSRRTDGPDFNNMNGDTFKLSDLQGLTASDASSAVRTNVNFSLVREAGTISCEGFFMAGRGAGLWTFSPNAAFTSAMQSRGFTGLSDEDLLRATFHDLTTRYIDDLKTAGYDKLSFDLLVRGAGHDVTVAYIRDMQSVGFTALKMEELIRARNHDIDSKYVAQVARMGFKTNRSTRSFE